jgi:hypothetical protein
MTTANSKFKKLPQFITHTLTTKYSNLLKPDVAFGDGSANHNITIVVDEKFQSILNQLAKTTNTKKINGLREVDGVITFKAKSKIHVDDGVFPCVDSLGKDTKIVPFGGDKVRLKLAPVIIQRDNSLSIYLNGIQVIEKNSTFSSTDFTPVKDGFVSQTTTTENQEDSDIPF